MPGLVYANETTAVGRYLHGLEVYNRYGYFETAGVPTDLGSVPVVRVKPTVYTVYGEGAA